jgi:hypothetical protein
MAAGFRIQLVDARGQPVDDLVSDQTFYVELYIPTDWSGSEGTAELEIAYKTQSGGE